MIILTMRITFHTNHRWVRTEANAGNGFLKCKEKMAVRGGRESWKSKEEHEIREECRSSGWTHKVKLAESQQCKNFYHFYFFPSTSFSCHFASHLFSILSRLPLLLLWFVYLDGSPLLSDIISHVAVTFSFNTTCHLLRSLFASWKPSPLVFHLLQYTYIFNWLSEQFNIPLHNEKRNHIHMVEKKNCSTVCWSGEMDLSAVEMFSSTSEHKSQAKAIFEPQTTTLCILNTSFFALHFFPFLWAPLNCITWESSAKGNPECVCVFNFYAWSISIRLWAETLTFLL